MAAIVFVLFFYTFNKQQTPIVEQNKQNQVEEVPKQQTDTVKKVVNVNAPLDKEAMSKEELKRLAASFAERYGSYSNQSNYQNMSDLKIFMTDRFKKSTDDFIAQMIAKKIDKTIYYGITTKAISPIVNEFDNEKGLAKITVTTQRRESIATTENANGFPQAVTISFKKDGKAWKVDDAVWQAKGD